MKSLLTIVLMGCIVCAATFSVAADTVKIATICGLTGNAASNLLHLQGARLAVQELNAQGGLLGKQIELIELDNQSSALGSKLAAKKAIEASVIAVIGASWSSHSLAVAPVLQEAQIPMISPISTNPDVTPIGDYIFRACFIDPFQGRVMANFALRDLNAKTAVVLTNTTHKYSMSLANVFIEYFQQQGKILWEGDYNIDATDFTDILQHVKTLQPDVIFVPGFDRDTGFIIKQARGMDIAATFLGGDGWGNAMYDYGGTAIEGSYFSGHWHRDIPDPRSQQFIKTYEEQYAVIEGNGEALYYDTVYLLADAVRRANSLDPKAIRDALAATQNFQGITGMITMNEHGDPVKSAVILKFDQGTKVFVKAVEP